MMELMRAALEKPPPTDKTIDDNTADLYRAFHVFVREKLMGEKQKQVHSLMPLSYTTLFTLNVITG